MAGRLLRAHVSSHDDNQSAVSFKKFCISGLSSYAIACSLTFMLSHPAKHEEAAVAATPSELRQPQGKNRRRQAPGEFFSHLNGEFFRNWFINGPKLLLKGEFSRRAGIFMVIAAIPAIAVALFLTLPGMLFPTPQHNQFFHFANVISRDAITMVPVAIGVLSTIFCLRLPLGP